MYRILVKPTCINVKEVVTIIIGILIISSSPLSACVWSFTQKNKNFWMVSLKLSCMKFKLFGGVLSREIMIIWSFSPELYTYINCLIFSFSEKQVHIMWLILCSPVSMYNVYDMADPRLLLAMKDKKLTIPVILKKINPCKSTKTLVGFLP